MNAIYFRKSKHTLAVTAENIISNAKASGWSILGDAELPLKRGKMITIYRPDWIEKLIENDPQLAGLTTFVITVFRKGNGVMAGAGKPVLLKALASNQVIADIAKSAEDDMKLLINKSAGVEDLKPKGVKLYSTMTCPYCKFEKSWLDSKKIKHDLVYVDLNPKEAQAMVDKTGQMGVPVTEIIYEDADPEYVVGFDKDKLAQLLNVTV